MGCSKSLGVQETEMRVKAAKMGVPVQQKKKTRNVSNVPMGDNYYWGGRHMFQTSNQARIPTFGQRFCTLCLWPAQSPSRPACRLLRIDRVGGVP